MSEGDRFVGMNMNQLRAQRAREARMDRVPETTELPHETLPFSIGGDIFPGVSKMIEEMGEMGTVLGKLMGSGQWEHWSGDLRQMFLDEAADIDAAILFFMSQNLNAKADFDYLRRRSSWKFALFQAWQAKLPQADWPRPETFGLPPIAGR